MAFGGFVVDPCGVKHDQSDQSDQSQTTTKYYSRCSKVIPGGRGVFFTF